jgi:hypothetical protein
MKEPPINTDQLARAVWLDPKTVGIDLVKDNCPAWNTLVKELQTFAVERFGTRNNNWAKIIPLVIHSLANDITNSILILDDTPTVGEPYQVNVINELFPNQEGLIVEVEDVGMTDEVKAAQAKRYGELFGKKEFMDPFWEHYDVEWKKDKNSDVNEGDPDLLM